MDTRVNVMEENRIDEFNSWIFSKRDKIAEGKFNTLPMSPMLKMLSYYYPGLDEDTYLNITAETKNGKSNLGTFAFILEPLWEAYYNRALKVNYLYINAEESAKRIKSRIVCYLLYKYTNGKVRIGYKTLISSSKPLSQEVCDILDSDDFKDIRDFYFDHIQFVDVTHPTGIEIEIKKFANKFGKIVSGEPFVTIDNNTGKTKTIVPIIGYEHNDPDHFKVIFFDNFNNTTPERGQSLLQAITAVSKNLKDNRNKLGFPIVALQQQSFENDSLDAFKLQSIEPKISTLGD